jgi:hypothetical protein
MSIAEIYKNLLVKKLVKEKLENSETSNIDTIQEEITNDIDTLDLTKPQFIANDYHIAMNETSSASKLNDTFDFIQQDLEVLYKELEILGLHSTTAFNKWQLEIEGLEKQIIDLESRITELRSLMQKKDYYFTFLDNLSDNTYIDYDNTTAFYNYNSSFVSLTPSSSSRIYLDNLNENTDISFKLSSTVNFVSRIDALNSKLINPFKQQQIAWWTRISMSKNIPVTGELWIKLGDEIVELNHIFLSLIDSAKSSTIQITPMYSVDNYNYFQLPTNTYTQEVRSICTFQCETIEAKYLKFYFTKIGADSITDKTFIFEFGLKEIVLYNDIYTIDTPEIFMSDVLMFEETVASGELQHFNEVSLETCERIEVDTSIQYAIAVSENSIIDPETAIWHPISPKNHNTLDAASRLVFNELPSFETTSGEISHLQPGEVFNTYQNFTETNYGTHYSLIQIDNTDTIFKEVIENIYPRYNFMNSNDRILNYQIKLSANSLACGTGNPLKLDEHNIVIYRNLGEKGLNLNLETALVRGVSRGWAFKEPYYSCIIYIAQEEGLTLYIGSQPMIVDNRSYTGVVPATVLTGKTSLTSGLHTVKVHKNNWKYVTIGATDIEELQSFDSLYPYNHKLLIEGYSYDAGYPAEDEKVYIGTTLFAEYIMKKVSIYDLFHNVPVNGYRYYALEIGEHGTDAVDRDYFIVTKIDESNPDFQNEQFMVKLYGTNVNYTGLRYLRLKAELETSNELVTPILDSYKVILR